MAPGLLSPRRSVAFHIRNVHVDEDEATLVQMPRLAPDIYIHTADQGRAGAEVINECVNEGHVDLGRGLSS